MGSDRKSKKRSSSPTITDSEGEDRITKENKRSRSRDDKERKRSSGSKREKRESERSRKHSKRRRHRSHKGEKSEDKHGHKHRKQSEFQELSNDDYFSKNNEFATWLKEERRLFFSDLSSEGARELFLSFVKDWNDRKLESRYYEGIEIGPRTAHNWKIRSEA